MIYIGITGSSYNITTFLHNIKQNLFFLSNSEMSCLSFSTTQKYEIFFKYPDIAIVEPTFLSVRCKIFSSFIELTFNKNLLCSRHYSGVNEAKRS